jgi:hypothetical protein
MPPHSFIHSSEDRALTSKACSAAFTFAQLQHLWSSQQANLQLAPQFWEHRLQASAPHHLQHSLVHVDLQCSKLPL